MAPPLEGCFPPQQDPEPTIEQVGLKCPQQGPVFTPLKARLLRPLSIPERPSLQSLLHSCVPECLQIWSSRSGHRAVPHVDMWHEVRKGGSNGHY